MNPELLALLQRILPFIGQNRGAAPNAAAAPNDMVAPGTAGTPDPAAIQAALAQNSALAGLTGQGQGAPIGISSAQAPGPRTGMGGSGAALATLGPILKALGAGQGGADLKGARFVHGSPQAAGPNVPGPQGAPAFQTMNNPMPSIGAFLLSPQGKQIMSAIQNIGR